MNVTIRIEHNFRCFVLEFSPFQNHYQFYVTESREREREKKTQKT